MGNTNWMYKILETLLTIRNNWKKQTAASTNGHKSNIYLQQFQQNWITIFKNGRDLVKDLLDQDHFAFSTK